MGTEIEADGRALRFSRRERALAQMEAHDLDALVLGRQANVRYISGAPQLWVVGTRPFGPICEFVRETGEIHLNSTWDEGIPAEIPHENLYGFAWNPMTLVGVLQNIKGAETFRRVGTDALTPMFAQLLPMAFPNAELVDAEAIGGVDDAVVVVPAPRVAAAVNVHMTVYLHAQLVSRTGWKEACPCWLTMCRTGPGVKGVERALATVTDLEIGRAHV